MYIRYFADTSTSPTGIAALEYLRSFMRLMPVRVCSLTGMLEGRWAAYAQLMATPMLGGVINAVCCDSSRWYWPQVIHAPTTNPNDGNLRSIKEVDECVDRLRGIAAGGETATPVEVITGRAELYTHGIRNVLFATNFPRTQPELETALRYEEIVVWSEIDVPAWQHLCREPRVIRTPVSDHALMRRAILVGID